MDQSITHFKRALFSIVFGIAACASAPFALAADLTLSVTDAAGKALPDAVVFVTSAGTHALTKPLVGFEIAQISRQFAPRVSVVPVGTPVSFPNKDTVRHHVYSFSPTKVFDLKLYAGMPTTPVVFGGPGVVVLGCNIHDQMAAWLVVVDTPFYGKTDAAGTATLAAIPPGNYTLRVWHPNLPVGSEPQDKALTVSAHNATQVVVLKNLTP
jgi:plastocyanin